MSKVFNSIYNYIQSNDPESDFLDTSEIQDHIIFLNKLDLLTSSEVSILLQELASYDVVNIPTVKSIGFKPMVDWSNIDGNVFSLLSSCVGELKAYSMEIKAQELIDRILNNGEAKSYNEAIKIMSEYVEIILPVD